MLNAKTLCETVCSKVMKSYTEGFSFSFSPTSSYSPNVILGRYWNRTASSGGTWKFKDYLSVIYFNLFCSRYQSVSQKLVWEKWDFLRVLSASLRPWRAELSWSYQIIIYLIQLNIFTYTATQNLQMVKETCMSHGQNSRTAFFSCLLSKIVWVLGK